MARNPAVFSIGAALLVTLATGPSHAAALPQTGPTATVRDAAFLNFLPDDQGIPPSAALFSPSGRAEVVALVNDAVGPGRDVDQSITTVVLEPDGSAVVVVHDSLGPVPVQISAETLPSMLSSTGHRVRDAAMEGERLVSNVAPTPWQSAPAPTSTPTPSPTTTPVAEPATQTAAFIGPDCAKVACVALTFDDGPGIYTAALLDTLAAKGAKATFFVLGSNVTKYPDLFQREVAEGHAIGNHSNMHPDLTSIPLEQAAAEIDVTAAAFASTAGVTTALVRPPYGASNDGVNAMLAGRGDAVILWNIDTEDWKNRDVAMTTQRALTGVVPGSIILMHDIHPSTVQAVPGIIDQLRAAGFTLVTVPELLGPTVPGQVYRHR